MDKKRRITNERRKRWIETRRSIRSIGPFIRDKMGISILFFALCDIFGTNLFIFGECQVDVAASMSGRHVDLSKACMLPCRRQTEIERAQIVLNRSKSCLPRSTRSVSPVCAHWKQYNPVNGSNLWEDPECRLGELENALDCCRHDTIMCSKKDMPRWRIVSDRSGWSVEDGTTSWRQNP